MEHPDSHRNDQPEPQGGALTPFSPNAAAQNPTSPNPPSEGPIKGVPAEARYHPPPFDAVPTKPRHDGWTPARQRSFIEALAATACVEDAARAVGMSARSAHLLRTRPDATSFRAAWDAALHFAVASLEAAVFSRAIHGVPVPHFYKGEQVGEHRRYNDAMAMFLMRHNDLGRYAKGWDTISPYDLDGGASGPVRAKSLFTHLRRLARDDAAGPDGAEGTGGEDGGV
jgi:hypothetical protein